MKKYTAQICINGHVITHSIEDLPHLSRKFCKDCGESTITVCQYCNESIEGRYSGPNAWMSGPHAPYHPPSYCDNCGKPFPWTEMRINTAKELIAEIENLSTEDKDVLTKGIDEIVKESPKTESAAYKFSKIISKAGKGTAQIIERIIVQIASETASKIILK